MSDDSRTPRPAADEPDNAGDADTGVIDVNETQRVPVTEHGWFDEMSGEHPGDGPSVPARADEPWGTDRARELEEERTRAQPSEQPPAPPIDSARQPAPPPMAAVPRPGGGPGAPYAYPPPFHAVPAQRRRGRLGLVVAVVALCLLSGVIGGVTAGLLAGGQRSGVSLPAAGPGVTERPEGSIAAIAASALPSVVTILVEGADDEGTGSGFVIDGDGHILTNNHVVAGGAEGGSIEVVLSTGETETATIVGRDVSYDLAVIRVERTDLPVLTLGQSEKVVVGDQVIAVGAPLGLEQTVTTGIISALNRPVSPGFGDEASYINAVQTDAAINPGNSGGPLLDMSGQVIGVNSAIARVPGSNGTVGGNIGLGFAIPSDQARRTAEQLIATGTATHPVIGVLLDRTYTGEGALVLDEPDSVTPDGPADKAGIQPGDVIVGFEGQQIRTPDALIVGIRARAVGDTVTLTIERDGARRDVTMVLEADPES